MKVKICVTLSRDLLIEPDRVVGSKTSRSALIEHVVREYLGQRARATLDALELGRINAAANQLNAEVLDALEYQSIESPRL